MAQRTGFGVLYPAMVEDQGWSVGEITGAFSAAMLVYSPCALLAGVLVDRVGVKATLLLGTALLSAGLIGMSLAREVWQIYALYALAVGAGTAAVGYVPMLKLLTLRASRRLGFAIGLFNAGQGLGALMTSPLLQLIVDHGGWRAGYASLGGAIFLGLTPLIAIGAAGVSEGRAAPVHAAKADRRLWQRRTFWLILLANSALGYLLLLPAHHIAHLMLVGYPAIVAASAGGLMGACIGIGAFAGGWLSDRRGAGRLGLIGAGLLSLGVLALIGSGPASFWLTGVYVLAGGLGRGVLGVNAAALQAQVFAGRSLGRITGLLDLGFGVGAFAGPYLTAVIRDERGSYAPGLATAILATLVAAVCASLARAASEREQPKRDRASHALGSH